MSEYDYDGLYDDELADSGYEDGLAYVDEYEPAGVAESLLQPPTYEELESKSEERQLASAQAVPTSAAYNPTQSPASTPGLCPEQAAPVIAAGLRMRPSQAS